MTSSDVPVSAVQFYDPAVNNYDVTKDPRCLFGWGPTAAFGCDHRAGHGCVREFGHPGKCLDGDPPRLHCESKQRPKDWDATGRTEANR